ncbi:kinesin family member 11 [Tieghemostelium lacteum]|uniref:Kinesin-like protein n=1 Tax=Tieghemostelium lacteum TaxID=361077 RepID=A0A151ZIQ9_TIELA|nr:kinesin family member 11 [Tieghemostelium lacteum]|eukprot:KYQ93734.1 kinesin family member 11 [Tieghemostelium lacteum]
MNENVIVSVRARPFSQDEIKMNEHCSWSLSGNTITSLPPPIPVLISNSTTSSKSTSSLASTLKTPTKTSPPFNSSVGTGSSSVIKSNASLNKTTTSISTPMKTPLKQQQHSIVPPSPSTSIIPLTPSKFTSNSYTFDHLFGTEDENLIIYDTVARQLVHSTMEGYNSTIFAYGITSSGKTFTMKGTGKKNPGIIPLAIQDVFNFIQQTKDREFLLRVSYMEIYNEIINDLLAPENINLKVHEHPTTGIYVGNLKEEIVLSLDHVMSLISAGEAYRHVGTTNYNDQSSRSHTILRMIVESKELGGNLSSKTSAVRYSQLNLIDLAGSEKASDGANAARNKEGAYINKSLLTLGTVIGKLSEKKGSAEHIPFRDSKLTRILQTALSGNSRIAIICTITLTLGNFEETHNSLKFAARAKKIQNVAKVNEILDDKALIKQYRNEIAELKSKLNDAMVQEKELHTIQSEKEKVQLNNEELTGKLQEAEKQRMTLESKIQHLTKLILNSTSVPLNSSGQKHKTIGFHSPSQNPLNSNLLASISSTDLTQHLTKPGVLGDGGSTTPLTPISASTSDLMFESPSVLSLQQLQQLKEKEILQYQSKLTKLQLELEERDKKIEFLSSISEYTGLEKIKSLESQLVQKEMDLSLYQRESTRLQNQLSQKEENINNLESKLRDVLAKCKELLSENDSLKKKVNEYEQETF